MLPTVRQDPQGMVYLRARWYDPAQGTLLGRDPFAGWAETPYSLHPFQYGYSDPVRLTDPTGRCVAGDSQERCAQMVAARLNADLGYVPDGIVQLAQPNLRAIWKWMEAGVRFASTPYGDAEGTLVARRFNAQRVLGLARALNRVEYRVGADTDRVRRMFRMDALGLRVYDFAPRPSDPRGGAESSQSTNQILIYTADYPETTITEVLRLYVHELGHVFDDALQNRLLGSESAAWQHASGWDVCPASQDHVRYTGAVNMYALGGARGVETKGADLSQGSSAEDFAETFAWYILQDDFRPPRGIVNRWNPNITIPNDARKQFMEHALRRF